MRFTALCFTALCFTALRFTKGLILAGAAALTLGGIARAEPPLTPAPGTSVMAGVGIVCNTNQQAVQFVALRASGQAAENALKAVNTTAQDPHACGMAAIAFTRDEVTDTRTVKGKLVQIVRIHLIAGFNGGGSQPVAGTVQFAVIDVLGQTI